LPFSAFGLFLCEWHSDCAVRWPQEVPEGSSAAAARDGATTDGQRDRPNETERDQSDRRLVNVQNGTDSGVLD